jgi:threonyl-tRNA synthetase
MLVIGDKEVSSQGASVRLRTGEDLGPQSIDEIQSRIQAAVESKA